MGNNYVTYEVGSARMDRSVPPNKTRQGSYGYLGGIDGRYTGGLRKFYGFKEVVDIADDVTGMGALDTYDGPSYFKKVTFLKRGTSTVVHGFVVRWDSQDDNTDEQIDLIYTEDSGSTWTKLAIFAASSSVTSSLAMDCETEGAFLFVCVDGLVPKTVYWSGAAYSVVDMGPGSFSATLGAVTKDSTAVDSSYSLRGNGKFQIAWRFYDSTRGIYSSLSDPLTILLDHYKTTKATGTISLNSGGGDSGLLVDGDVITINGRTYEADDDSSITSDVTIDMTGISTVTGTVTAIAAAINGDSSAVVTATLQSSSILLEATTRGSAGNSYTLSVSETGANTDDVSVSAATLTGGGTQTTEPEEQCKAVLDFPANASVVSGQAYANFAALFDTVEIFRSIDLGESSATQGAIFYLEQEIAKTGNWATSGAWDALQVTIGTKLDDALPFQRMYDPQKDIVTSPPHSGSIGRYERITFMGEAAATNGGFNTLHSSLEHVSAEYFTTYNKRWGTPDEGRPSRFIPAGDSLFQLSPGGVTHIFKQGEGRPLQFTVLHRNRGLVGAGAAHSAGNSVFMITPMGAVILNATDGNMGQVSSVDRILLGDWQADLSGIQSGYDSKMNCSFFLNPTDEEMFMVWHTTQVATAMQGVNFVNASHGASVDADGSTRTYFITATGLVVRADDDRSGSGTLWDLSSSYTLNGTATSSGATLIDTDATFHADMIGCKVYFTSGDNAGVARTVSAVDVGNCTLTFSSAFDNDVSVGDYYAVSPIPVQVRWSKLRGENVEPFERWNVKGFIVKSRGHSGVSSPTNKWRLGIYRNGGNTLTDSTVSVTMDESPDETACRLNLDGIDVEPYLEQISSGSDYEILGLGVYASGTISQEIG